MPGLRIVAFPLTRPRKNIAPLVYYYFQSPPPPPSKREPGPIDRATAKAVNMWVAMGQAPETSWKRKSFLYGERLMNRIDYEESALRSIHHSQVPQNPSMPECEPIPLIYPKTILPAPLEQLSTHLQQRRSIHTKGLSLWVAAFAITLPMGIIPVIPNLPFYFAVWRAYSHYRARKSVTYLESFMTTQKIIAEPSSILDTLYTSNFALPGSQSRTTSTTHNPPATKENESTFPDESALPSTDPKQTTEEHTTYHPDLLLDRMAVPKILASLDLPETGAAEFINALDQANARLTKADKEGKGQ